MRPRPALGAGRLRFEGADKGTLRLHSRGMLSDLDRLMRERCIDTILVPMHESMHPSFRWITRGAKVTRGYALKAAGRDPLLVAYPMERDEAAASGVQTKLIGEFDFDRIFHHAADPVMAYGEFFDGLLRSIGSGRTVALFGNLPVPLYLGIADDLQQRGWMIPHLAGEDLVQRARKRKDLHEIEAIASVGERTEQVVDQVRQVLRTSTIDGQRLLHQQRPLTLGDLKQLVSSEIARLGMTEDHETILSQGRDAGIPHSRGDASALVRPSVPIVLDIFPADRSTGYFFDLTRTFCVGPIPEELRAIHADVLVAFEAAARQMRAGTEASSHQAMVCDLFEQRGYVTSRSMPGTQEGYVHGLGHGVGLEVHERPSFSLAATNRELVETGDILTIEPGLYFPDREIGVRVEETFVIEENGSARSLCRSDRGLSP